MEEEQFKILIQRAGLEEPNPLFTDDIMKLIEGQEALNLQPALLSVLKDELLIDAPPGFSEKLMSHLKHKTNEVPAPIVTRKMKLVISCFVLSILIVALLNSRSGVNHIEDAYFSGLKLSVAITAISKIADTFFVYLVPLSILLLFDYLLRAKKLRLTAKV